MNNICYFNLATYSQTGGIENFNKTFLRALDDLEKSVTSVSVYDNSSNEQFKNINFKNFKTSKVKSALYILRNIFKIETLFVAHVNLLPVAMLAKLFNPKLRVYLSIYGVEVWKKLPYIYRSFLKRITVLSISTYTTNMFIKFNDLDGGCVHYLPPDTSISIDEAFTDVYNSNEFNILSVTRLDNRDSYKGVDSILKSIPLLVDKIPNLKYTIIGKGDDKKRLESLAENLNIEKYVDFKGFVEFLEPYYQYCDLFSLPSKGEGFGIVYIEAMKYKKPCIACDEGGQTDVVINNRTGFLCKYDDIQCLANKTFQIYSDNDIQIEFGKNGYEHLINNFTFEKFISRLDEILNCEY